MSNSSKKSGSGGGVHGIFGSSFCFGGHRHGHRHRHRDGLIDISPILHKSVSCFDPVISNIDIPAPVNFSLNNLLPPLQTNGLTGSLFEGLPIPQATGKSSVTFKPTSSSESQVPFSMGTLFGNTTIGLSIGAPIAI